MDIQEKKIHFVQEFLRIKDEGLIDKFEKLMQEERMKVYESELKPMSINDFDKMIDSAEADSNKGRLSSSADLKGEIDSWT